MLRHQTIAFALFLSAGCELAGAPPAPPAKPVAPAPTAVAEPEKPAEPPVDFRPAMRAGPSWGKERPRFKVQPAPATPAPAPAPAPAPKADAP